MAPNRAQTRSFADEGDSATANADANKPMAELLKDVCK